MTTEVTRVLNERLKALLADQALWGEWLTFEEVQDRQLNLDALFTVWCNKTSLLDRATGNELMPKVKLVGMVLDQIQINSSGVIFFHHPCGRHPARSWTSEQVDDGVLVMEGTVFEEQTAAQKLTTVSDWCSFMGGIRPPVMYDRGDGVKVLLSIDTMCRWLMIAHFSGPTWYGVGLAPLRWDKLVRFFGSMHARVGGLCWCYQRNHTGVDKYLSKEDVSLIQKHLHKYVFNPGSSGMGRFSYKRDTIVWNLCSGPGNAFVLAVRESTTQSKTPPESRELRTVHDLCVFLSAAFPDVYFTADRVRGKKVASHELATYLMQQFKWW
jgi:hypothetical protein